MRVVILAILAILAGAPRQTEGQIGYLWTHGELLQKADLAVIAECLETVDTGRVRSHPSLTPPLPVHELQTTFRVAAVLKGSGVEAVGAEVRLRHYRYTAEVAKGGLVNVGSHLGLRPSHSYLLFLVRRPDGVFEPLSGHTFPEDSVYRLEKAQG